MAILASLFGVIGRFAGKLVNSALGWATILLFGRVPQSRQILLSVVTLGSIAWVVALLGVVFPDFGAFLLTAIPAPKFIDRGLISLAMLVAAFVLPLLIGVAALFLVDKADRPKGAQMIVSVLRGYVFCFVLAVTLVFLAVIALVRKVRSLSKRWEDAHVGIVVKPGGYETMVDDLRDALDQADLGLSAKAAPRVLALPAHILAAAAGSGVRRLVPDRLMELTGANLEILVYPSDIAISGTKQEVARARAAVASRLTAAPAYLTTSEDSQKVEDRIEAISRRVRESRDRAGRSASPAGSVVENAGRELAEIDKTLAALVVPYDEWEVLYRMRLQVERDLLTGTTPGESVAGEGRVADRATGGPKAAARPAATEWAISAVGIALVALDVTLSVADRVSPSRRPRR